LEGSADPPGQELTRLQELRRVPPNFFGRDEPKVVAGIGRPPHGLKDYCVLTLYMSARIKIREELPHDQWHSSSVTN